MTELSAGDISKWVHDVTWDDRGQLLMTGNANGEIRFWKEKPESDGETVWEEIRQKSKPIMLEHYMVTSRTQPNQVEIFVGFFKF